MINYLIVTVCHSQADKQTFVSIYKALILALYSHVVFLELEMLRGRNLR